MTTTATTYNPVTGEDYDQAQAARMFAESAHRNAPSWQLGGEPGSFYWSYFNFKPFTGRVRAEADGFHWSTCSYDTGAEIASGVTTSLFEAYQSVVQNREVRREP